MSNMAQPKKWPPVPADQNAEAPGATNVVPIRMDAGTDSLESFKPETAPSEPAQTAANAAARIRAALAAVAVVAVAGAAVAALYLRDGVGAAARPAPAPSPLIGRAVLHSRPEGAAVIIDGVSRGVTPLELELAAGSHDLILRSGLAERRIELKVEGGTRVSENVDLAVPAAQWGTLEIVSDPAGARVSVDGSPAGVTPLTLRDVAPASHTVAVTQGSTTVHRTVEVAAGATASVVVSLAAPQAAATATGSFTVESPFELRILEGGQLLGLSNAAPLLLPAGKHQFDLVNESLEVRVSRAVTIDPGKSTRLSVPAPSGTLAVNALPWAEVFVDGKSIGMTPLGAVSIPIGTHEVVWRHPQLGEKRRSVVVGAQTPVRVSMDLNK